MGDGPSLVPEKCAGAGERFVKFCCDRFMSWRCLALCADPGQMQASCDGRLRISDEHETSSGETLRSDTATLQQK